MNQRFDPNDKRPVDPATWPDSAAAPRNETVRPVVDPLAEPFVTAPMAHTPLEPGVASARPARSNWPILLVLIAGVVLALLVWLPADRSGDMATQPAPASQTATPPADATATSPAATSAAPDTAVTPATPPAATPETPATGTQPAPAANGAAPAN